MSRRIWKKSQLAGFTELSVNKMEVSSYTVQNELRRGSLYVYQWHVYLWPQYTMWSEEIGLLTLGLGWSAVHWQVLIQSGMWQHMCPVVGVKRHLKTPSHLTRKDHNKIRGINFMGWNHHRHMKLHIWNGNLLVQRYTDKLLKFHVMPCTASIVNSFLLMHNNARPCTPWFTVNMLKCRQYSI